MKVGVTGSRHARPAETLARLRRTLVEMGATELHHGDCFGFDEQAHGVAVSLGLRTVAHPPINPALRAFCEADEVREPLDYLPRNREIVHSVDRMIAAPDGPEKQRSGTWSTVRYAKSKGVRGVVLPW
ncbi:MAG: hypothetical protein CMJ32_10955 [Phycisphaerae bacterium]|nr:hypothetical protein [Phycisphaerae bacterium]